MKILVPIFKNPSQEVNVAEAVEIAVKGEDYDRGELETIKATSDNTAKMLGQLMLTLHNKTVLSDKEVCGIISTGENACVLKWEGESDGT